MEQFPNVVPELPSPPPFPMNDAGAEASVVRASMSRHVTFFKEPTAYFIPAIRKETSRKRRSSEVDRFQIEAKAKKVRKETSPKVSQANMMGSVASVP